MHAEFAANLQAVIDVLHRDQGLVDYLADRLVALGESVPGEIASVRLGHAAARPFADERLYDFRSYPADLYVAPGASVANRAALGKWGAWANAFGAREYGRPLFLACSADLTESTNLSGFGKPYGDFPGYGWYLPLRQPEGRAAAAGDHRVRQRRHPGRPGHGQLRPRPGGGSSTASGAPARPTAPSRTSSTACCGCSASSARTASSRWARCSMWRAIPAPRRRMTAGRTSASTSRR